MSSADIEIVRDTESSGTITLKANTWNELSLSPNGIVTMVPAKRCLCCAGANVNHDEH